MILDRGRVTLLDANVLIAWVVEDHEHHDVVVRWLQAFDGMVALCPITEGALVRHLLRMGESGHRAVRLVAELHEQFESEKISFEEFEDRKTELFALLSVD